MSWRVMGRLLLRRRLGRDGCDETFCTLILVLVLFCFVFLIVVLYLEKRCALAGVGEMREGRWLVHRVYNDTWEFEFVDTLSY
jgi:hypothetical protein